MFSDKRGNLLSEETLKIVIAVICIIFLVSLLVGIYNSYTKNKEVEMAKTTLVKFNEAVSSQQETFDAFNPVSGILTKFYLVHWAEGTQLPSSCSNVGWKSCICICRTSKLFSVETSIGNWVSVFRPDLVNNLREECPQWSCSENKNNIFLKSMFEELKTSPTSLTLDYSNPDFVGVSKQ